ncbi:Alpha amylase, catalytic domain containing protein [Tritrichomonas foetus]|uniref:Alpha-amylase n=1 Tax=Tritrichomonas foetus TaxID=1144522 RepID=A0A1J4KAE6_9EUKA|nr:Alpha amylase, catalytic domain containing protein [Tritrichomonas foetus]|eukprot:OHT08399.1 Alpha amylase, catalytic domain containing protein [Tritrichomonas foetus]
MMCFLLSLQHLLQVKYTLKRNLFLTLTSRIKILHNIFCQMEDLQDQPLLSSSDSEQYKRQGKRRRYLWMGICVGIGLFAGVLVGYLSFGLSKNSSSTALTSSTSSLSTRALYANSTVSTSNDLPDCQIYETMSCSSSSGDMDSKWESHQWNTPKRGETNWKKGYQDMSTIVGYARLTYGSGRKSCTVTIYTRTHHDLSLTYYFDGVAQTSNTKTYDSSYTGLLQVKVVAATGETLELDEIDFYWNLQPIASRSGDYRNGQKGAIVEMFGWPDADIAKECKVIADAGYLGVKLFPHQEQIMSTQPFENELNPWYFMYQPVSYRLQGRAGSRSQLREMIKTCRSYGLRVYADAVVNHMSAAGNDAQEHRNPSASCTYWPGKQSSANETQSPYYTASYTFGTNSWGEPNNVLEYPAVPYGPMDFHCDKSLNSWTDPNILNTGWLVGLTDLATGTDYVRQRIADYFVDLLSIGFSGFRVDAAKHIHPDDLAVIFKKLKDGMGGDLPEDWFTWLEVITGGESSLLVGDSDYSFTTYFANKMSAQGLTDSDIEKVKIWWSGYPNEPGNDGGRISLKRKVIQNDDHDQQNDGSSSRDIHDKGCVLVKGCDVSTHRNFEIKLFTNPEGVSDNDNDYPIRMLLSSYYFSNGVQSIPDGQSDCSNCVTTCDSCRSRGFAPAYVENANAYEGSDYTRVHRDAQIIAAMRTWMHI